MLKRIVEWYKNIGTVIKGVAIVGAVLEAFAAVITGIVMIDTDSDLVVYGLLVIFVGPVAAWLVSLYLYAFGELVEKTSANESNTRQILKILNGKYRESQLTPSHTVVAVPKESIESLEAKKEEKEPVSRATTETIQKQAPVKKGNSVPEKKKAVPPVVRSPKAVVTAVGEKQLIEDGVCPICNGPMLLSPTHDSILCPKCRVAKAVSDPLASPKKPMCTIENIPPMKKPHDFSENAAWCADIEMLETEEVYARYLDNDDEWTDGYRYLCYLELKKRGL